MHNRAAGQHNQLAEESAANTTQLKAAMDPQKGGNPLINNMRADEGG